MEINPLIPNRNQTNCLLCQFENNWILDLNKFKSDIRSVPNCYYYVCDTCSTKNEDLFNILTRDSNGLVYLSYIKEYMNKRNNRIFIFIIIYCCLFITLIYLYCLGY